MNRRSKLTGASIASCATVLLVALSACISDPGVQREGEATSSPLEAPHPLGVHVQPTHAETVEKYSSGDSDFAGLYNTFELKATLLGTVVRESLLKRQSEYYLWDPAQLATEREKATQELSSEIGVFLSFYTPERKNDNLADAKSIWKVYLDAGGRRYVGTVKRDRRLIAELQALYPFHTRWNTAYQLKFPVAATAIESQPVRLTVTGPMGSRVLEFRPSL